MAGFVPAPDLSHLTEGIDQPLIGVALHGPNAENLQVHHFPACATVLAITATNVRKDEGVLHHETFSLDTQGGVVADT